MGLRLKPRRSAHYCAGLALALVPLTMTAGTAPVAGAGDVRPPNPGPTMAAELPFGDDDPSAWTTSRSASRFDSLSTTTPAVALQTQKAELQVTSPKGTRVWTPSAMSDQGIPAAAERAYRRAARTMADVDAACQLPWTLLAAIGRVESDHGRYGGSVLGTDGVSHPRIIGVQLNGAGPVAAIPDTDDGKLDGDKIWDRAVGPMQFIPSTWEGAARDGDGDGTESPNDLDDAALAAAGYLCSGYGSVLGDSAMGAAIYRYNQDDYYVALVTAFERGYRTGVFIMPPPPEPEGDTSSTRKKKRAGDRVRASTSGGGRATSGDGGAGTTSDDRGRAGAGAGSTDGEPTTSPSPKPSASPSPKPSASPSPKPSPSPSPSPTPDDEPEPGPQLTAVSGLLGTCGAPSGWCVDGRPLDLGPDTQLGRPAASDYSGEGDTGTNTQELETISATGSTIDLLVEMQSGVAVVYVINGDDYRYSDGGYA